MTENNFKIESAAITDRGLSNKRPQNEDSYLELNHRGFFSVADGVGGAQAGDVASQMAVEIVGKAFDNLKPNEDAEELMKIAIERANEAIYQMSREIPQLATMATTIVGLHLAGNIATIGHVGDSRLYLLDGNGTLFRKTEDHSMVEEEVRAGRMTADQASNHPGRNIISRALGADYTVEVELKTIMFEPNTTFLLCSDGITRHINDFELREFLISEDSPAQICQKMKDLCFERGAEDNLTAVIARISDVVAGNKGQTKAEFIPQLEENTAASARKSEPKFADSPNFLELGDEQLLGKLEMPIRQNLPPIELEVAEKHTSDEIDNDEPDQAADEEGNIWDELMSAEAADSIQNETPPVVKEYQASAYDPTEPKEIGFFGKFLSGFFMFLIGAIVGAGAIYIFTQNAAIEQIEKPQIPQKMQNTALTDFEDARRGVDDDAAKYIQQYEGLKNKDVEDLFLLGRAFMITGKYELAKKQFEEARNRLGEANENNDTVMANDIAAYLAIIENGGAQRFFSEEIKKFNQEEQQSNKQKSNTSENKSNK